MLLNRKNWLLQSDHILTAARIPCRARLKSHRANHPPALKPYIPTTLSLLQVSHQHLFLQRGWTDTKHYQHRHPTTPRRPRVRHGTCPLLLLTSRTAIRASHMTHLQQFPRTQISPTPLLPRRLHYTMKIPQTSLIILPCQDSRDMRLLSQTHLPHSNTLMHSYRYGLTSSVANHHFLFILLLRRLR